MSASWTISGSGVMGDQAGLYGAGRVGPHRADYRPGSGARGWFGDHRGVGMATRAPGLGGVKVVGAGRRT